MEAFLGVFKQKIVDVSFFILLRILTYLFQTKEKHTLRHYPIYYIKVFEKVNLEKIKTLLSHFVQYATSSLRVVL